MKRGEGITPHFSALSVLLQQRKGIELEEHPAGHEL